jgi:hypothetical protein
MTSPTDKTKNRRRSKKIKNGYKRKNKLRVSGTTPELFALNKPVVKQEPIAG